MNGWACAVKFCHDGMLEDTDSLGAAHLFLLRTMPLGVLCEKLKRTEEGVQKIANFKIDI